MLLRRQAGFGFAETARAGATASYHRAGSGNHCGPTTQGCNGLVTTVAPPHRGVMGW